MVPEKQEHSRLMRILSPTFYSTVPYRKRWADVRNVTRATAHVRNVHTTVSYMVRSDSNTKDATRGHSRGSHYHI